MITHETPGDTFWDRIRAGAEQAAKDTGSTLKYSADPEATKQATLIQGAIDAKVDGIATTLVTPDALIPTVKKAVAAGIPVDSFNSGTNFYQQAGSIAHFSSDEKLAGQQAGAKAKAGRGDQDPVHHPADRVGGLGGSLCRCEGRLPEHREHPGQRRRTTPRSPRRSRPSWPRTRTSTGSSPSVRLRRWTLSRRWMR